MKRALTAALLVSLTLPILTRAEAQAPGPVAAALKVTIGRYATNMPGAADLMPAEKYSFKPTPEQMSFGEIIAHEAESNETLCGAIAGGSKPPTESAAGATAPKDQLVARLKKSFDDCATVVAALQDGALGDSVPFYGGRKVTRARAAVALAQDWADHYAQAAMYLRLNGILPPSARPKKP
jgi:hypothetical protein